MRKLQPILIISLVLNFLCACALQNNSELVDVSVVGNEKYCNAGMQCIKGASREEVNDYKIMMNIPHSGPVGEIKISHNGKFLVSSAGDIKLWDAVGKRLLKVFRPDNPWSAVVHAVFNNGNTIISGGTLDEEGQLLKFWNTSMGVVSRELNPHSNRIGVFALAISPGEQIAASIAHGGEVLLWKISNGEILHVLQQAYGQGMGYQVVRFSHDGEFVIAGGAIGISKWKVDSGKLVYSETSEDARLDENCILSEMSFDLVGENGSWLMGGMGCNVYDAPSLITIKHNNKGFYAGHTSRLGEYEITYTDQVVASPDGRTATSIVYNLDESGEVGWHYSELHIWDIETGKTLYETSSGSSKILTTSVVYSPNSDKLYIGMWDGAIEVVDLSNMETSSLTESDSRNFPISINSDGSMMLSGIGQKLAVWDIRNGALDGFLDVASNAAAFMPGDERIISVHKNKISIYSLEGRPQIIFESPTYWVGWHKCKGFEGGDDKIIEFVKPLTNGRHILIGGYSYEVECSIRAFMEVVDVNTGQVSEVKSFTRALDYELNDNNCLEWAIISDNKLHITDGADIKKGLCKKGNLQLSKLGLGDDVIPLEWSSYSNHVLAQSNDGKAVVNDEEWSTFVVDILKNDIKFPINTTHADTARASFTPDNSRVITKTNHGAYAILNADTGEALSQFVINTAGEWLFITPEGYFNASLHGAELLHVVKGLRALPISRVYDVFYRPDILRARLAGEDIVHLVGDLTLGEALRSPPPDVLVSLDGKSAPDSAYIKYEIFSTGGGIGEITAYHNGKLIYSDGSYLSSAKNTAYVALSSSESAISRAVEILYHGEKDGQYRVKNNLNSVNPNLIRHAPVKACNPCKGDIMIAPLPGEENIVTVVAKNRDGTIASMPASASFISTQPRGVPQLWMLVVGINQYKEIVSLINATKDARDFANNFEKKAASIFRADQIHIMSLLDAEATKRNIVKQLETIAEQSQPEDTFILFVASHGMMDANSVYGIVPVDVNCLDDECSQVKNILDSNEILEASRRISALTQLVILDTCNAGGLNNSLSGLYDARMSVLAKGMGLHLFASTSATELALDGIPGRNGIFTESLLSSMDGEARDEDNNNYISVIELGKYTRKGTELRLRQRYGRLHQQNPKILHFGQDSMLFRQVNE